MSNDIESIVKAINVLKAREAEIESMSMWPDVIVLELCDIHTKLKVLENKYKASVL